MPGIIQSDTFDFTAGKDLPSFEIWKKNEVFYLHNSIENWACRNFILSKNSKSYTQVELSFAEKEGKLLPKFKFSRCSVVDNSVMPLLPHAKKDKIGLVDLSDGASKNFWDLVAQLSECKKVDATNFKRHKIVDSNNVIEINDENLKIVVRQLIEKNYSEDVLKEFVKQGSDFVESIAKSVTQIKRENNLKEFKKLVEENCSDETGRWQPFFERCSWIFGLGLDYKFLQKIKRELKTGLGDENDKGQSFADFGLGLLDEYSVLVELKTPDAEIFMASEGDSSTWKVSSKLANSLVQLLSQKTAWVSNTKNSFPIDPKCILVYGNTKQIDNETKRMTFEIFRRDSRSVEVVTYDELFKRAYYIVYERRMPYGYLSYSQMGNN